MNDEALLKATEKASDDAMLVFSKIVGSWEGKKRPIENYDYIVLAQIISKFVGFGYLTVLNQLGREGAERWLTMALGLSEDDISKMGKVKYNLQIVRDGKRVMFSK